MEKNSKERELIIKMLAGELSFVEEREIAQLIHKPLFGELLQAIMDEQGGELEPDTNVYSLLSETKLNELYNRVAPAQKEEQHIGWFKKYRAYVAAVAIIFVSGFLYLMLQDNKNEKALSLATHKNLLNETNSLQKNVTPNFIEKVGKDKGRVLVTLPDGSIAILGKKSKIRYPENFAIDARKVQMEGEVFFEVVKEANRPFTVVSNNVQTKVLGTSFKIVAVGKRDVEVAVVTGKVSVERLDNKGKNNIAIMLPGDKVAVHKNSFTKSKIDPLEIVGWKNEQLVFRKQSLKSIMTKLEKQYGVKVTFINEGFMEELLSVTLEEKYALKKTMNILSVTAGFDYTIDSVAGKATSIIIK